MFIYMSVLVCNRLGKILVYNLGFRQMPKQVCYNLTHIEIANTPKKFSSNLAPQTEKWFEDF